MARKKINRSPEEILWVFQVLYALEKKAARIYHQLAEDSLDPWVKKTLEHISQEEAFHMAIARRLIEIVERRLGQEKAK